MLPYGTRTTVFIGKSDAGDLYFDGVIDEVRIYYRALQGEEI